MWHTPPQCSYALGGLEEGPLCVEALTQLVEAHAWRGQSPEEAISTWKAPDHLRSAAETLAARGAIARVSESDKWQLTWECVQSLTFLLRLHSPEPACDVSRRSARTVADMTRLELWSALEAGGWTCQPAGPPGQRRAALVWDLQVDSTEGRIFYLRVGPSPLPPAQYMQALLSRDALLRTGVHSLPHFRPGKFYAGVLRQGAAHIAAPSPADLQDDEQVIPPWPAADAAPRRAGRLARAPRPAVHGEAGRHTKATAQLGPFGKRFARRLRAAAHAQPAAPPAEAAAPSPAPEPPVEAAAPSPVPAPSAEAAAPSPTPPEEAAEPSPMPPAQPVAASPALRGAKSWTEGAFTFSRVKSRFGGVQVICPFHAQRSLRVADLRTRCTKTLHLREPTAEEFENVVSMCRWWSLQYEVCDRKQTHATVMPREAVMPHPDILRERCLATRRPASEALLDEDLDAVDLDAAADRARAEAASGAQPDDCPGDASSSTSRSSTSRSSSSSRSTSSSSSSSGTDSG